MRLSASSILRLFLLSAFAAGCASSRCVVRKNETAELYPVYAHKGQKGDWNVPVHGRVYEPAAGFGAGGALSLFKTVMSIPDGGQSIRVFEERAEAFLAKAPEGRKVRTSVGDKKFKAGKLDSGGHFESDVAVGDRLRSENEYEVKACQEGRDSYAGEIYYLDDKGLSVVSTVEDTIQVADLADKSQLGRNLLFRDFEPVNGMVDLFSVWRSSGAAFHYVTSMPWQLYPSLGSFLSANGFPGGSVAMRRWADTGTGLQRIENIVGLFAADNDEKSRRISAILDDFPHRRFILVGNTGGTDPAVFAGLARRYADRIESIYLRDDGNTDAAARAKDAFRGVPETKWQVFRNPADITPKLSRAD